MSKKTFGGTTVITPPMSQLKSVSEMMKVEAVIEETDCDVCENTGQVVGNNGEEKKCFECSSHDFTGATNGER